MKWGILFRWQSFWIGAHWSPYNKRLCLNLVPFITVWVTARGGSTPNKGFNIYRNDLLELKQLELENELLEQKIARKLRDCDKRALTIDTVAAELGVLSSQQINLLRQITEDCIQADMSIEDFKQQVDLFLANRKTE